MLGELSWNENHVIFKIHPNTFLYNYALPGEKMVNDKCNNSYDARQNIVLASPDLSLCTLGSSKDQ